MVKKTEVTGKKAATAASKVLRNPDSSKTAKSAAGSALSQTKSPSKVTSMNAATAASKTLSNKSTSKTSKTAAGSALTQRPGKKK